MTAVKCSASAPSEASMPPVYDGWWARAFDMANSNPMDLKHLYI
ncbi:MAG: hypothetical protein ABIG39_04750 [Candidatus Micrarchaeota archaeon]